MRRLALAALFVVALVAPAHAGNWLDSGTVTNPAANQVILTTGALQAQTAEGFVLIYATTNARFALERLDVGGAVIAADSITLPAFPVAVTTILVLPMRITFNASDTFRVRIVGGVTGTVGAIIRLNEAYCRQGLGCAR